MCIDDFDSELVLEFIDDYDEQEEIIFGEINIRRLRSS